MFKKKQELGVAIRLMFGASRALNRVFSKKPFTPDGRMVGDIGEAIAEIFYRVTIDKKLRRHWDGFREEKHGIEDIDVQVKTTQKDSTYLKKPPREGSLLVFKILPDGSWECCYNGSIMQVWESLKLQREDGTHAKTITLDNLRKLPVSIKQSISLRH